MFTYVSTCFPKFATVYSCLPMFANVYICLPLFTHSCLPKVNDVYVSFSIFTHFYSSLSMFTFFLPMFNPVHSCIPVSCVYNYV